MSADRLPSPNHPRLTSLRLLMLTLALAILATIAQTSFAAPGGGPGFAAMGGMPGMPGMPGMGGRHHLEHMLDLVRATPEQRTQIGQIVAAAMADQQAQRDARRALHEQARAAFTQPTVDAQAVEKIRQQALALHDQASRRMTQAMIDISRVLTLEQRKALADAMQRRLDMMQRHRAERESLEPRKP